MISTTAHAQPPAFRLHWSQAPFFLMHIAAFGAIWTGVTWFWVGIAILSYYVRMFFVTGAYHRYFAHRSYKTSRIFQFILAFGAETTAQKGALWWAAHHRHHHRHSDTPEDTHSPRHKGVFYAHNGWVIDCKNDDLKEDLIKDFLKYPELRFIDKHHWFPPLCLALLMFYLGSWEGLVIGFVWSTCLLWQGTFVINSFTHLWGKRDFPSTDDSKNSFIFSLVTLGEGWHNNHHFYQASCRQGFYWWQIDITYYILKILSLFRIVWDIKEPPQKILDQRFKNAEEAAANPPACAVAMEAALVAAAATQETNDDDTVEAETEHAAA